MGAALDMTGALRRRPLAVARDATLIAGAARAHAACASCVYACMRRVLSSRCFPMPLCNGAAGTSRSSLRRDVCSKSVSCHDSRRGVKAARGGTGNRWCHVYQPACLLPMWACLNAPAVHPPHPDRVCVQGRAAVGDHQHSNPRQGLRVLRNPEESPGNERREVMWPAVLKRSWETGLAWQE